MERHISENVVKKCEFYLNQSPVCELKVMSTDNTLLMRKANPAEGNDSACLSERCMLSLRVNEWVDRLDMRGRSGKESNNRELKGGKSIRGE